MTQPIPSDRDKLALILFETLGSTSNWGLVADRVIDMIVLAEDIGFNKGVKASLGIDLE